MSSSVKEKLIMGKPKFNDHKLLQLIDKQRLSQSRAAKELGVSRQAVSQVYEKVASS